MIRVTIENGLRTRSINNEQRNCEALSVSATRRTLIPERFHSRQRTSSLDRHPSWSGVPQLDGEIWKSGTRQVPVDLSPTKQERDMARKYSKGSARKVERAMKKRKAGTLKSGRSGKKVKSRKQAIAIGLSEARKEGKKVPKKKTGRKAAKKTTKKTTKKTARKKTARKTTKRTTKKRKTARKRRSAKSRS
jgi:hypothetical protein